ncbi:hypothetical protein U14_00365 [Candidatus Moduliflexus flocculans]|uniref:Uncharacterized protein n=1 Tax=Candidatus Moduliflexus flocculans TaxID=1499966 RepID=A0A0S6VPY3_9BACT|nr:hypothetical protein U14_00365 [Candidatus Moduliflexus flocculans]
MGSCAKFWLFRAASFAAFLDAAAPSDTEPYSDDYFIRAEDLFYQCEAECVAVSWQAGSDGFFAQLFDDGPPMLSGEQAAAALQRPDLMSRASDMLGIFEAFDEPSAKAFERLQTVIGLPRRPSQPTAGLPWWVACFGEAYIGLLSPQAVAELRAALRETRLIQDVTAWLRATNYSDDEFEEFCRFLLDSTGTEDCWLLAEEGTS